MPYRRSGRKRSRYDILSYYVYVGEQEENHLVPDDVKWKPERAVCVFSAQCSKAIHIHPETGMMRAR